MFTNAICEPLEQRTLLSASPGHMEVLMHTSGIILHVYGLRNFLSVFGPGAKQNQSFTPPQPSFVIGDLIEPVETNGQGETAPTVSDRVDSPLYRLHQAYTAHLAQGGEEPFVPDDDLLVMTHDGHVTIEASADDIDLLIASLHALGAAKLASSQFMVLGELPILSIPDLAAIDGLRFVRAAFAVTFD